MDTVIITADSLVTVVHLPEDVKLIATVVAIGLLIAYRIVITRTKPVPVDEKAATLTELKNALKIQKELEQ